MNTKHKLKHPRTGYRKPGAKRATLALRMTDEDKALLMDQAAAAGISAGDHVAALAQAYQQAEDLSAAIEANHKEQQQE